MPAVIAPWRRLLAPVGRALGDVLCPPVCVACEAPVTGADRLLCTACRADLPLTLGQPCRRCGEPTVVEQPTYDRPPIACGHCTGQPFRFDEVIATGAYDGLLRDLTLLAKQQTHATVALALGDLLADMGAARLRRLAPDVVTCVPMHWTRRFVRQSNGPELMAERLAERLALDFSPGLLRRVRLTARQPQVARSQRASNVRRAFRVGGGFRLHGATVALVDDILTTGATCSAAAAELKRAGAGRVVAVVAARTQ